MRHPSRIKISDLEAIQSVFDQELTSKEAEKIVGGASVVDQKVTSKEAEKNVCAHEQHEGWPFPVHRPELKTENAAESGLAIANEKTTLLTSNLVSKFTCN